MWTRRAVTGLAVLGATGVAAAQTAPTPTASDRRAEAGAIRSFAEATHPRGREAAADANWRAKWDALAAEANTLSDGAYFVRVRSALAWFKDGHTTLLPFVFTNGPPAPLAHGPFALSLPIRVRVFADGAYVTEAKGDAAPLLGARVTRIGSLETNALMQAWAEDWPGNDAWAQRWAPLAFNTPAFLQALGAVSNPSAPVVVEGEIGARRVRATLRPSASAADGRHEMARTKTPRETWANENGNYARLLPGQRALYISLDDMSVETGPFGVFTRDCFANMADASADRLILDLRRNGGGNNYLTEALRKHIERSRFNKPGGLYVLTSGVTFSAAQNLTNRIERETFAIFAGEPTGGAPNHYGDAKILQAPVTGISVMVSSLPWFDSYPQDTRIWTAPDLPAPNTFADWRDGRDTALEAALAHHTDAADDDWSTSRVFYFSRASQSAAWRPFWRA